MMAAVAVVAAAAQPVTLPDGRRINLDCTGAGSPTVPAGGRLGRVERRLGPGAAADRQNQPGLQLRPGRIGRQLAGPLAAGRQGGRRGSVGDDRRRPAEAPPFVLVGHSAGGLTMRLFADAHPAAVAAMVLVDPSVEGQFDGQQAAVAARVAKLEACADAAAAGSLPSPDPALAQCSPPLPAAMAPRLAEQVRAARLSAAWWRTEASEYAAVAGANSDAVRAGRQDYGTLPLIVLTSGVTAAAEPSWEARHKALAARSRRGVQRTVAGASHNIMHDAPEAVAAAVAEVAH